MKKDFVLILPDIRSAQNVGAIFRTADAVGVTKIYLTGYTPCPIDKFERVRKDIAKSALGAEKTVPWEYKKDIIALLNKLKKDGYKIIAIEQDEKAVDYKKVSIGNKNVFIVGNETEGIDKNILNKCDIIAEIPMQGRLAQNRLPDEGGKESLNVSVATGVALFRILHL